MRLLFPTGPPPADDISLDAAYATPEAGPWVRANFAVSVDGAVERGGTSSGVSGAADKRVFSVLRGLADVVLVGAGTARVEGYRPARPNSARRATRLAAGLAEVPTIAVVTSDLGMDLGSELFSAAEVRPILITTAGAPPDRFAAAAAVADVLVCGEEHVEVGQALDALHDRGHRVVLCEGGPTLFAQLMAAGRVDELCLTVSPLLVGPGHRLLAGPSGAARPAAELHLAQVLEEDGALFLRYQRV